MEELLVLENLLRAELEFNSSQFLTEEVAQDRLSKSPLNEVISYYLSVAHATN